MSLRFHIWKELIDLTVHLTHKLPLAGDFDLDYSAHYLRHCIGPLGFIENWIATIAPRDQNSSDLEITCNWRSHCHAQIPLWNFELGLSAVCWTSVTTISVIITFVYIYASSWQALQLFLRQRANCVNGFRSHPPPSLELTLRFSKVIFLETDLNL